MSFCSFSQSPKIDSLNAVLGEVEGNRSIDFAKLDSLNPLLKEATGNRRGHLLNEISLLLPDEEALIFIDQAIKVSTDSVVLARAHHNMGINLYRLGRLDEAEQMLDVVIPAFEKVRGVEYYLQGMYSILGKIKTYTGQYSLALKHQYKNLALVNQLRDSFAISARLLELGISYYKIRNNSKALEFLNRSLTYSPKNQNIQFLVYMNSSLCYRELGFPSIALVYCKKAFRLAEGRELDLLHAEFATGFAQLALGSTVNARRMFNRSLQRSTRLGDTRMQADNLLYIGKAWLNDGVLDSAHYAFSLADDIAGKKRFNEIKLDILRGYMELANRKQNTSELAYYQEEYIKLKKQLYNIHLERVLASLEGEWHERENQLLIEFQREKLHSERKAMQYQKWTSLVLILIVILVLSIIVVYLKGLFIQKESQRFLEDQLHNRSNWMKTRFARGVNGNSNFQPKDAVEVYALIDQSCNDLIRLLKNSPKSVVSDSSLEYLSKLTSDKRNAGDLSKFSDLNLNEG